MSPITPTFVRASGRCGLAIVLACSLSVDPRLADAQMATARELPTTEVGRATRRISEYAYLVKSPVYEVRGTRVFEEPVLVAERLILRAGSRLVLASGKGGDQGERSIAARVIQVDPGEPPTITWLRDDRPPLSPSAGLKGTRGTPGVPGGDGARGGSGSTGNPGIPGRSAPTLYLFVSQIQGGPIKVDLRGQDGGEGSPGQEGGDGGPGGGGRRGETSVVGCIAPGGDGGAGGPGGRGGRGGPGGRGGTGGTLILVSASKQATVRRLLTVDNKGGKGGPAGKGGPGGSPGPGGAGGAATAPCLDGKEGIPGPPGEKGDDGDPGEDGVAGAFAVSLMTDTQFARMLDSPR